MAVKHRKLKLSGQRTKWVANRDTTLLGGATRLNPRTAEEYAKEVTELVYKMHLDVSGQVERLFSKPVAKQAIQKTEESASLVEAGAVMDASISVEAIALTNKLVEKWTKRFASFGDAWTNRMMKKVDSSSAKDLGRSMNKLSGGLTIDTNQISESTREKMLASADQASSLIKSIGPQYMDEVKEAVARSIVDSSSSFTQLKETIHNSLQQKYKTHKNKAFNVAKDQMRKSYTAITASRMQDLGSGQYIWRHAGGSQRPRCFHRDVLNGQTFSLDNPPIIDQKTKQRGKPGDLPYCSCYMEPVISFENKG